MAAGASGGKYRLRWPLSSSAAQVSSSTSSLERRSPSSVQIEQLPSPRRQGHGRHAHHVPLRQLTAQPAQTLFQESLSRLHCQGTWVAARRTGAVDGGSQVALHDAGQLTLAPHLRSRRTAEVPAEEIVLQLPLGFPL